MVSITWGMGEGYRLSGAIKPIIFQSWELLKGKCIKYSVSLQSVKILNNLHLMETLCNLGWVLQRVFKLVFYSCVHTVLFILSMR